MLVLAAAAQALRLSRWGGSSHGCDPLVRSSTSATSGCRSGWCCLALRSPAWTFRESAGVHALTAGAMTTMILAVMTAPASATPARKLKASPMTVAAYRLRHVGALLRVAASFGIGPYPLMLDIAGGILGRPRCCCS